MKEPFKQNDVFKHVDFDPLNACVGNNGGPYDLYDYAKGYFDATSILLENVGGGHALIDLVVYPICFDFRHAVELYLKYVITDLAKVKRTAHRFKAGHSLLQNWKAAKSLLKHIQATEEDVAYFETVVTCIDEVDRTNGQTFRYPESIKGDQHLKEWSTINLPTVKTHNTKIAEIAHSWHRHIEDALETSRVRAGDNISASVPVGK
ncbi:hypothetical protein [Bradyrhizobium elkanii]|uniref:hypothetical protein n=1 Tax=Bradyrhizobium elkanii TaxID=29448 RepID=UPI0020A20450|nr:hypothetical protein [Bradyrhizobium elkanii]MCP1967360.1 hypothetical protein [Bradyrhizobium elkanii]MCS3523533.1 hypothetical protein [Bradyrhizobium elkanii]MCS4071189.1 hypothetical protein [Bradyrhizobium elkanii]MCS4077820.1 hypothetical protein [Bradyrhizobium elkanii]MCS4111135.1 hypothetical protein [Bradyrhizobium elkanii]